MSRIGQHFEIYVYLKKLLEEDTICNLENVETKVAIKNLRDDDDNITTALD